MVYEYTINGRRLKSAVAAPGCVAGCPVDVDIPGFVKLIAEGRFIEAALKLKETNALPAVCGRVCPQEEQCEKNCVLTKKQDSVAIGRLERFVADWEASQGAAPLPPKPKKTGKKVAVVGSGPGGLICAGYLIQAGHDVTIFEALHKAGGVLVYGIPEFRLPKAIVQREVEYLQKLGVELKTDFVVGKTRTIGQLMQEDKFDAVYIGVGAGLPWFMDVPGENLIGVYSANEYLTRNNLMKAFEFPNSDTPIKRHKNVAVVGGGNVAMDSVRTALRLGADNAYIVYRRGMEELPARKEEVEHAQHEGVQFKKCFAEEGLELRDEGRRGDPVDRFAARRERDRAGGRLPVKDLCHDGLAPGVWAYAGGSRKAA